MADWLGDRNIVAFAEMVPDLLVRGLLGRTVLIHDAQLVGDFDNWSAALNAGYERFGLGEFIVQEVKQPDAGRWVAWLAAHRACEAEYASWIALLREAGHGR